MELNIHIRNALPEDMQLIHSFMCDLENIPFNIDLFNARYLKNLQEADCIYLVAVYRLTIIGFISCHGQILLHHEDKVFEIQEMYVDKKYRNTGIGRMLIAALEKRLSDGNCQNLEVTTNKKRINTRKFYGRLGFKQTHLKFVKPITS